MLYALKTASLARYPNLLDILLRCLPIGLGMFFGLLVLKGGGFYAIGLVLIVPFAIVFISKPFIGICLWLLLLPFASVFPNSEMMYWLLHRILITVTLSVIVIDHQFSKRRSLLIRLRSPDVVVVILAGFVPFLIFIFQSNLYWQLIRYADRILIPLLIYLIIRLNPLDEPDRKLLIWTLLFVVLTQGVIGLVSIFAPGILPQALRPLRPGYASGTLDNPNVYAIALVFCGLLLYHSAMGRKSSWGRSLFLIACGLCAIGVFFSMERAAWLAGAMVMMGLLWKYPKSMFRNLIVCGITILALLMGGFLSKYIDSASARLEHEQPLYDRIVVSDAMLQMVQEKPLFGWGYETLNQNITNFYRRVGDAYIMHGLVTSHNTYLTMMAEQGLIAFLLYMFPAIWLLVRTFQAKRLLALKGVWTTTMLAVLWLAAISYLIITNLMDMRFFPYGFGLWWMTLALIANIIDPMVIASRSSGRERNYTTHPADSLSDHTQPRGYPESLR